MERPADPDVGLRAIGIDPDSLSPDLRDSLSAALFLRLQAAELGVVWPLSQAIAWGIEGAES